MIRPVGLSPGATALAAAWLATVAIALLTGASAVVILLALGAVAMIASLITGRLAVRNATIESVSSADTATAGEALTWRIVATTRHPVTIQLRIDGIIVATGRITDGVSRIDGTAPCRGVHDEIEACWSSAGWLGLVWWRRTMAMPRPPLFVAPAPGEQSAETDRRTDSAAPGIAVSNWAGRDDVDGVRAWRDGDEVNAVHWPSSLRTGDLVIKQRLRDRDESWVIAATTGTGDSDQEAARVRVAGERALAASAQVAIRVDAGEQVAIASKRDLLLWCARFDSGGRASTSQPWWRRDLRFTAIEPATALTARARWMISAAGAAPLVMLLEPLGYETPAIAACLAATAVGAATTVITRDRLRAVRQLLGIVTAVAVGALLIDVGSITSVATSLRFLLPQVLVGLVVLQGFECIDRRGGRVALACSALLTAYSAGVRVDDQLAIWLLLSTTLLAVGLLSLTSADRLPPDDEGAGVVATSRRRIVLTRLAGTFAAAVAVFAILALIPIPRGPAQLTLPSWLEERRPTSGDGALAAPDGSPLLGGVSSANSSRAGGSAGAGGAGSYPGFSPTMDTSLRGDLGDQIVLRVRSPYPDYWRGQTFTEFDGRTWFVDDDVGVRSGGPEHLIRPATGDVLMSEDSDFIQTFYAEVDLPNLVFATSRPTRVLLDAPLWQRPDGALRADVVLPAGSAYTVVSQRSGATAELLRSDGDLAALGSPAQYLQMPESTTARTRDLAVRLSAGSASTYDTILAIHEWLAVHVEYDLDAGVPPAGDDAVDHFLFESERGFCEQIATSTAIMLRSLGIPARVATGYVPSDRDEIAGVWISRASDAHAWVEVRFPSAGWVAFDPTASVPLSGEANEASIGGDLVRAIAKVIGDNIVVLLAAVVAVALALSGCRIVLAMLHRRRRGRWGLLQDRFVAAAVRRGADTSVSNADMARVFDRIVAADATRVAEQLDASAFASAWIDDDHGYVTASTMITALEHSGLRTD